MSEPIPSAFAEGRPRSKGANKPTLIMLSADRHAVRLIDYIAGEAEEMLQLTSRNVQSLYRQMCRQMGLVPHPWNTVAKFVRRTLGNRKHDSVWMQQRNGGRRRVVVFRFPPMNQDVEPIPQRRAA